MQRIGIVGGGAWGTALAVTARRAGRDVVLWAREAEVVTAVNQRHENPLFLPGIAVDPAIAATGDVAAAASADAIAPTLRPGAAVVICAKGVEEASGALMSEVAAAALPGARLAILSGPTFAGEVARGLPTAVTLATVDQALGGALIAALGTRSFRPYLSADVVGAEIGGAVKNVLAIACGIVAGRRLGDNARAALITRGLAEMVRLAQAKGGRAETLMGLSGLGDLTLTCTALQSRNHSLGFALGEGTALDEILARRRSVAEGVSSAAAVTALARRLGVDMPIVAAVDAILHHGADIDGSIASLLARPFRGE
jgi:glycerol-3-phosphate dehydrogenase (NAD(P)+)